jgi:predicted component of type VI protein secretion system
MGTGSGVVRECNPARAGRATGALGSPPGPNMLLALEIVGPHASSLGASCRKTFSTSGGTIGRVAGNDWVLPVHFISGYHAAIEFVDGSFCVVDTGSANGVFLNSLNRRLESGKRYPLAAGDRLFIEPFEIRVSLQDGDETGPAQLASTAASPVVAPAQSPSTVPNPPPSALARPVDASPAATPAEPSVAATPRLPAHATAADASQELAALFAAAGLDGIAITPSVAANFQAIVGVVVGGLMDVLRARDEVKREFHLHFTGFQAHENNPLKFSVNAEDALHNLLTKRNVAYLNPLEAFDQAFEDVRAHQTAMLAGLRAAFHSMLSEFDPARLEQRFERYVQPDSTAADAAKQRYWSLYHDHFQDLAGDPDASFRRLFGDAFAKAYDEHVLRPRRTRRGAR